MQYHSNQENALSSFIEKTRDESSYLVKEVFINFLSQNKQYKFGLIQHSSPKDKIKLIFFTESLEIKIEEYINRLINFSKQNAWSIYTPIVQLINPISGIESEKFTIHNSLLHNTIQFNSKVLLNFRALDDIFYKKSKKDSKVFSPYKRQAHKKDGLDIFRDYNSFLSNFTYDGSIIDNKGFLYRGIEYIKF